MSDGFLIGRVPLRFDVEPKADVRDDLSVLAFDGDGNLWLGSDEGTSIERLRPSKDGGFGNHRSFDLREPLRLRASDKKDEIDVEGMDIVGDTLWLTGSHTSTRDKPEADSVRKKLKKLAKVSRKPKRYVVGRIPVSDGAPSGPGARLDMGKEGNALTEALRDDPHLGPFLHIPREKEDSLQLASKENGFDIEGLAVHGERVFLGLRGPVMCGWAALLIEIEPKEAGKGELKLKKTGRKSRRYRKHFVDLGGMGLRDLCWQGDDLLMLAGPTMDLTGLQRVWRLRNAADLHDDSLAEEDDKRLQHLFDLPIVHGADKAEGIALYDGLGEPGLMILYDAPSDAHKLDRTSYLGDVYRLRKG